jgi:nitroreductase
MTETSVAPTRSEVERAVHFAVRAPSIHNTQPWRWVFRHGALELFADRSRQLPALDPDGHSLLLSCGGALALAQLGFATAGWSSEVDRRPDPDQPDLLARIRPVDRVPVTPSIVELARAAERRHTERLPFTAEPVPVVTVRALVAAAAGEGVYAHPVERPDEKLDLAVAFSWADGVETTDPAYRAELARWTRYPDVAAPDGVPAAAVPQLPAGSPRHTDVPMRDFGVAGGRPVTGGGSGAAAIDERPLFLVIFTTDDDRTARLRAGEAYVRLSLEAERLGLASSAMTQAVDLPAVRERFRVLMDWPDRPQLVLRIGWPPAGRPVPATSRRPLSAVLTIED